MAFNVCFLNVGEETERASLLSRSVFKHNPLAKVIQLTDMCSPEVPHVSEVRRFPGDSEEMIRFRLMAYAAVDIASPTWFLDTDMLVQSELPLFKGLALCVREFDQNKIVDHEYKGAWKGYEGKTLGEIFPILGCTIFSQGVDVWTPCLKILNNLSPKFFYWNGDQEALRIYSTTFNQEFHKLKESVFACLPERISFENKPKIIHFKGRKRKPLMLQYAIASKIV